MEQKGFFAWLIMSIVLSSISMMLLEKLMDFPSNFADTELCNVKFNEFTGFFIFHSSQPFNNCRGTMPLALTQVFI